ncbi:hypothetical protein Tco_0635983 [Tanacetum coccineum]
MEGGEEIIRDLERLDIELCVRGQSGFWASLRVEPNLISQIKTAQKDDGEIWAIIQNIDQQGQRFRVMTIGILWQGTKLWSQWIYDSEQALMTEAHSSPFLIHPGSTKDVPRSQAHFWWSGQSERTIQTSRRLCYVQLPFERAGIGMTIICLVEFDSYKTVAHAKHKCAPFEMLYGGMCAPICWDQGVLVSRARLVPRLHRTFEILDRCIRGYKLSPLHVLLIHSIRSVRIYSYTEEHKSILDCQDRVMEEQTFLLSNSLWEESS